MILLRLFLDFSDSSAKSVKIVLPNYIPLTVEARNLIISKMTDYFSSNYAKSKIQNRISATIDSKIQTQTSEPEKHILYWTCGCVVR